MMEKVDIMIKGGTLLTMDMNGTIYEDGAIAVNNGRIVEVGKSYEVMKKYSSEKVIDANRKVIMQPV